MSLFPVDETDVPSLQNSIIFGAMFGGATIALANLIHNQRFYYQPLKFIPGIGIGVIAMYVLHGEAIREWRQLKARRAYFERLRYQQLRDFGQLD